MVKHRSLEGIQLDEKSIQWQLSVVAPLFASFQLRHVMWLPTRICRVDPPYGVHSCVFFLPFGICIAREIKHFIYFESQRL